MKQKDNMPRTAVDLEVSPDLGVETSQCQAISEEVSRQLADLLHVLGIPGVPAVKFATMRNNDKLLRLVVNGEQCLYPNELLWRIQSFMNNTLLAQIPISEVIKAAKANHVEFLSLSCLEIIKQQPAVLFGIDQAAAYQELLSMTNTQSGVWPSSPDWLLPIIHKVLNLKFSIADWQVVANVLCESLMKGRSSDEVAEDLIATFHPEVVEIHVSKDYLRQLTTNDTVSGRDKFSMVRDGLFYELGIKYPDFCFVPVENFNAETFSFKINNITTLPRTGLPQDRLLVNDTPDRLENFSGKPAINPVYWNECSHIDSKYQADAVSIGLTTWNSIEYMTLCMAAELKKYGICFVSRRSVQYELDQVALAFPALVKAVLSRFSLDSITRMIRNLAAEEISVRNLRLILEWLLDYDYIVSDSAQFIIFDNRLPLHEKPSAHQIIHPANLTSFVRTGLKRYISHKYTRGGNTLVVYLLDPQIERLLPKCDSDSMPLNDDTRNRILKAVRQELREMQPSVVILTTIDVRASLRNILAPEFPKLPVVAYQELSPDMNIQPIARRISWEK